MSFHDVFPCLWCGAAWTVRGPDDLEGWAQLCATCLGRAGTNTFLRGRLRTALAARAPFSSGADATTDGPASGSRTASDAPLRVRRPATPRYPALPDDWFLRRGAFEHGAIHDTAWHAELDMVTRWLDELPMPISSRAPLPMAGIAAPVPRIAEPGAGTGFFSPLLAGRGELHASDADGAALDIARDRLVAHRLRAHLHAADPWRVPDGEAVDAVVAAFLLGRVRGVGLDPSTASLRARLRTGGRVAVVELLPDPAGGPPEGLAWTFHDRGVLEASLARAGIRDLDIRPTGRFFLLATGRAG
jgi:SAM-dependent methyltransferase